MNDQFHGLDVAALRHHWESRREVKHFKWSVMAENPWLSEGAQATQDELGDRINAAQPCRRIYVTDVLCMGGARRVTYRWGPNPVAEDAGEYVLDLAFATPPPHRWKGSRYVILAGGTWEDAAAAMLGEPTAAYTRLTDYNGRLQSTADPRLNDALTLARTACKVLRDQGFGEVTSAYTPASLRHIVDERCRQQRATLSLEEGHEVSE